MTLDRSAFGLGAATSLIPEPRNEGYAASEL
jgi:hypothetical protein